MEQKGLAWIYTVQVQGGNPVTHPPKKPMDRMKEWVEQLGQWIDGLVQPEKPELIPVPVRRPDRRRPTDPRS
jgi:hypothetical protein